MEFRILGPLEVIEDGRPVELGGAKQGALLAMLLLSANRVVSTDRLIDALWDESPPANARKTLQVYVSQLRKAIGRERVETRSPGYVLRVGEDELDVERARRLAAAGEHAQALAEFRGRPLADFEGERFATGEAARLEELRLAWLEDRIAADLAAGRQAVLAGELEALVGEFPVRERLRELLMVALYRSGRQAEALEAFQAARRALVDELGIEPSRSLRELHQAILRQDPALDPTAHDFPAPEVVAETRVETVDATPAPRTTPIRSERKTVTAVHVRVEVTSAERGRLDAELLQGVLTRVVASITAAVERHEGSVELVTGDAVTAIFGLPVVHEDDAARAARAADDLLAHVVELGEQLRRDAAIEVRARVGVSTGEVVTGGADTHVRATGEPLTRAAQLAQTAEPNAILLDETTRRAAPSRRDNGRFASPMVGRGRERRRLLDAFEQATTDRSCQLFTILGPAGVGKSRLVQEFLRDVSPRARVARGRCLPYGEGITFWPVLEAVKDVAGIGESESVDDATASVTALVEEEPDVAVRVAELIGLREGSAGLEEGFAAVRDFFELLAARGPVVVVFDDVHWGEETFLDLVEHLADWSRGAPLLLLCVARPELLDVRPQWGGGKLNATTVLLEPLSEDESAELVANLVGEATLAEEVQERIARAAEGNPLFVEEMLSMLIDEGALVRAKGRWTAVRDLASVPVPPTIQALLAARLDQLSPDERAALEAAAVEGKVFHESSVAALTGGDSPAALASLVRKELVRPERPVFAGERAFRFRHLMIRDATYDAIPKERRATLHERHVGWLEDRTGERSVEFDEILGYHLEQAVLYRHQLGQVDASSGDLGRRAAERLAAAARRAFSRTDIPAGLNLASRAAFLLSADDPLRLELVPNLRAIQGMPEPLELDWADRILTEAVEAAATSGDRRLAAHALVQRSLLRLFSGADVTAQELLTTAEQATAAFEALGDELGLSRAWRLASQAHYLGRRAEASAEAAERALVHARRAGDQFEEAEILEWLLIALMFGPRHVADARERCRRLLDEIGGRAELEAMVAATLAWIEAARGESEVAQRLSTVADETLREHGLVIGFAAFCRATTSILLGDRAEAEQILLSGYDPLRVLGRGGHYGAIGLALAQLSYLDGRYADAERLVDEASRHSRANDVWNRSHERSERAKILAREGDTTAAESLAREAVAYASTGDFVLAQVDALTDLAEVLRLAERYDEAIAALGEAIELSERKGNVTGAQAARDLAAALRREATGTDAPGGP